MAKKKKGKKKQKSLAYTLDVWSSMTDVQWAEYWRRR